MGLLKKGLLAVAAVKAVQLLRKPENQQRAKDFASRGASGGRRAN